MKRLALTLGIAASLAIACGGGGGGEEAAPAPPPPPPPAAEEANPCDGDAEEANPCGGDAAAGEEANPCGGDAAAGEEAAGGEKKPMAGPTKDRSGDGGGAAPKIGAPPK